MSRYYDNNDEDIRPGRISAELKAALNLAENDVPIWIYRMRALGYPPGWLSKAIVDTSDIFDTDPDPASRKRKGAPDADRPQYDHSKLIEYPGFNTPLPPNTQDYHYYYNMPPMLPHQQLDYAKSSMKPAPTPPQKRSRSSTVSEKAVVSNQSTPTLSEGIKLVSKGSPMPKPVDRLPLERFSEGVVGELLYFENIPNSTGKFDSIRGLLNTMRQSRSSDTDQSFDEASASSIIKKEN